MGARVRLGRFLRVEDDLDDAGAVTDIHEHEAAVVTTAMHPAGHAHALADAVGEDLAAPAVAILVR